MGVKGNLFFFFFWLYSISISMSFIQCGMVYTMTGASSILLIDPNLIREKGMKRQKINNGPRLPYTSDMLML